MEDYIKENSLVIVNENFYDLIIKEEGKEEKEQNIYCSKLNDLITIYIGKKEMKFHSNSNILYSIKESYIRILIKVFYFQKELNNNIKKPIEENKNIKIGIIQKDWIKEFKSYLDYDNLKVLINNCSKFKEYNYSSFSDKIIDNLVNNVLKDYKDSINKENKFGQLNFGKDKQLILNKKKINKPKSKTLKYYNDFEIVSSDILSSLQILFNNFSSSFYEVKSCIIGNNKIIILIQDEIGDDYYEIGNINNNIFNVEYLLDFNQKLEFKILSKILYKNDFEDFLSNIYNDNLNNFFPINSKLECFSYKINIEYEIINIDQINDNNNQINENYIIDKVKNTLLSIYLFEQKLNNRLGKSKDKISNKNNLYFYKDCYLINSELLSEFKKLFLYDYIIQKINSQNKNKPGNEKIIFDNFFSLKYNYYSTILKDNYNQIINNDLFGKLNQKEIIINKNEFSFYDNLNIINEEIYLFLNEFSRTNNKIIEAYKNFIIVNNGKIIFKHSNSKLKYILAYQKSGNNSFEAEMIFHFLDDKFLDDYFLKLNEQRIDDIFPDKLIDLIYNEKDEIIGNLHLLKYYQNELQEKEYNYKKYLEILIMFYIENKKFMYLVENKIEEIGGINEEVFFMLNTHWIDEFNYLFEYETIYKIFNYNEKFMLSNDDMKTKIDQISNKISNDLQLYLNNLKEEIIFEKLNNKNLYEITNYKFWLEETKICSHFFSKCLILPQKFFELLIKRRLIIDEEKEKIMIKCLYGDNRIFSLFNIKNEEIIEIGKINEYNIFKTEIIISNDKNMKTIFEIYKYKGMKYIRDLMKQNKIEIVGNIKYLKIDKLNNEKELSIFNINSISNIFRTLLLICINQYKLQNTSNSIDENIYINQKFEEAFLIDSSFLYQFEYNKIKNMILKNNNIISKLKKYLPLKEEDLLNIIFKDLDLNILKEIDKKLKQIDILSIDNNNLIKKPEKVILLKNKNVNIYNYFVIFNAKIMSILINNLNIKTKFDTIKYISYNEKFYIMIDDENQYSLLLGRIINDENIFKLEYIFDFKTKQNLKIEIKKIIFNCKNYINELNNINIYQNDYIFPIYSKDNNKKVGVCYKYSYNITDNNYSKFQINKELFKIVYLYINNKIINSKLNNKKITNFIPHKYCLVNSELLNYYKSFYNYNKIKEEINSNKKIQVIINKHLNEEMHYNIKKLIYLIIKNLNQNIKNKENQEEKIPNQNNIVPNFIQIKYYDNSHQIKQIMVYNNFEILNRDLVRKFLGKNINIEQLFIECYIINNYIIINFPNKIKENKLISLIGEYKKIFVTKYILIYDDEEKRKIHLKSVLNNLNIYLNSLQFYENSLPIIDEKFNIMGTIIILKDNYNNNKKSIFNFITNIGLKNIGSNRYMNATLQCFFHIEKFVNFFKYNPQISDNIKNKNNLSSLLKLLIEKIRPNNLDSINNFYETEEFKNTISKINNLFTRIASNDLKYLIKFIILTLHEELNYKSEKNKNISNLDQTNKNIVFQAFVDDFTRRNHSIISDLFYSVNYNIIKCATCNTEIYNYQIYFFLNFSLDKVYKFINHSYSCISKFNSFNNQNKFINNNMVNIYHCFDYYRKINYLTGENALYCDKCKITCDCSMCTYLVTGPEILILLFNYEKVTGSNTKLYFEENLNLSNYIEYKDTGCNYKLIGVITYIEENNKVGKYIAYCRDSFNSEWYKYNDEIVNFVENFQNEVINSVVPYFLLYEKVDVY